MKQILRSLCPPFIWSILKVTYNFLLPASAAPIEWEYMPQGWLSETLDPKIKGWNVESILKSNIENWSNFLNNLEDTAPFGISPESNSRFRNDVIHHNIMMTYAYALALASRYLDSMSMLDWGGGIGHYYLISKTLVPKVDIDYHCKDVPVLAKYGSDLFPEAHFYDDETCFERNYDFVLVSGALQYSQDWVTTLKGLAKVTSGYLFVTRLPILQNASSFVMVQRPYQYGYDTEYLGWCLNRQEFLSAAKENKLQLIREFVVEPLPPIHNAPEHPEHWGFLFYKN